MGGFGSKRGRILAVDDEATTRRTLAALLEHDGYDIETAQNGVEALRILRSTLDPFELVLLDLEMPEMSGYEVLELMRSDPELTTVPVVVISGVNDMDVISQCIELGADDYLAKPYPHALLFARVRSSIAKKRAQDAQHGYLRRLELEDDRAQRLLANVLPVSIANRLKKGEDTIADSFESVSVLFADLVGFTPLAAKLEPRALVTLLNRIFSRFDELAAVHQLEKIKTIGDAYLAVGNLPEPLADHVGAAANMALDMMASMEDFADRGISLRAGLHVGPVIAGVIGNRKLTYDLWGDTVNVASRMESHGVGGRIQVTSAVRDALGDRYHFEERGPIEVKGRGKMETYFLLGRRAEEVMPKRPAADQLGAGRVE